MYVTHVYEFIYTQYLEIGQKRVWHILFQTQWGILLTSRSWEITFFFPEYTYARLHYLLLNGNPEALKYYYLDFAPENISIKLVAFLPC